jgi:benzoate-CoA ligase
MTIAQPSAKQRASLEAIPRDYNFAADILKRNLDAGRIGKIAFIDHRGSYSYGELAERVQRFAHALGALGVRREERILICLTDTIDWPTAFLGAIKAGVVAVPVNTLLTEDDYAFMLADSRARLLVVSEDLFPRFAKAIAASKDLAHVLVSGDNAYGHLHLADVLVEADTDAMTAPTTRDDMCFWLYTSGSTGKPKGAVHTHADLKLTDDPCTPARSSASPRTTFATRWRNCSSPMGSAMRSPLRCRRAPPPCCCRRGRRRIWSPIF